MADSPLLSLSEVRKSFVSRGERRAAKRVVRAVDGVTLSISPGETLAIVGESGSGKTTIARLIVGLTSPDTGRIEFDGRVLDWRRPESRRLRGQIQMVFQDPMGSLDPRWRVRDLVREPLDNFRHSAKKREREAAVDDMLEQVGLDATQGVKRASELSGGQRQRVGIARAVVLHPKLVVCDEPVSALDVSIRGQILDLLERLGRDFGLTYVFISHDLSTVEKLANRVLTLYLGQVVEVAGSASFFERPLHPYAQALLSAIPLMDPEAALAGRRIILKGEAADASRIPTGCRFHPRCPLAKAVCRAEEPILREVLPGRWARCHFAPDAQIEAMDPLA
jgi:oligopeptide/dipeptide ABC transporter ATP-binding protein